MNESDLMNVDPYSSEPVQQPEAPVGGIDTRSLILKYVKGQDPNLDKVASQEDSNMSATPTLTSRDWGNRAAKKAAKDFIRNPNASFQDVTFDDIWANVLKSEGGYANNPNDPGGETKYGISRRSYPNEDIANMTALRAQEIFKSDFYDAVGGDSLMKINPGLAAHVSDMAFNAGPKAAIKLLYDAVQLPRESQITPELIDRLNNSDNLIKDYSVARLKYYASLANAPTFIKGWTNRVNNLNKSLKIKSGLNGAYKAAKALDVDALVQNVYSTQDQLAPRFRELDQVEIERLQRANEMLSPGYKRPSSIKKETSSIGDVFKATYDAKYYTNTIDGMNELAVRSAMEASEANRKALGDKFDKSLTEKLTFGLYGGINSIEDWQNEVNKFKAEHPEVKLPYENASQVYAEMQKKAKQYEDAYNSLDSGNFKDGISASLNKLGHVVAGYLPGEILGSMSDRAEGAINLLPIPGATSAKAIAKGAAAVMTGTAATQAVVQPKRQELGLEGGFTEGATNVAMAGVGQAVIGTLANLGTKLWRSGSKDVAKEVFKETERLKKALKSELPDAQTQQLGRAIDSIESHAKELSRNPYGTDFNAKVEYEVKRSQAMEDILSGRPVRDMDSAPVSVIDNTEKLSNYFKQMYSDAEIVPDYASGISEWNKIKKSLVVSEPKFQATVPIEVDGSVPRFTTREELDASLSMFGDEFVVKQQDSNGQWYAARPAELESLDNLSTRFDEGGEIAGNVKGLAGSQDVEMANKYPDLVKVQGESAITEPTPPKYSPIEDVLGREKYLNDLKVYGETKLSDLDKRYEASVSALAKTDPEFLMDVGETSSGELMKAKDIMSEITEERSALSEMFNCMIGREPSTGV